MKTPSGLPTDDTKDEEIRKKIEDALEKAREEVLSNRWIYIILNESLLNFVYWVS